MGLEPWRPREKLCRPTSAEPEPPPQADEWALSLWAEGLDPRGTPVEAYLRGRDFEIPDYVAGDVCRYHPALWLDGQTVPGMLTLLRHLRDDEPWTVQRTFLTPAGARLLDQNGNKIPRKLKGAFVGLAAIKVSADWHVHEGLVLSEGFETALGAMSLGLKPVWAACSAGAIGAFPVLNGVEAITVLGERDPGGSVNDANERESLRCQERWESAGCEFRYRLPRVGDFADAWSARQNAKRRAS